ncbi:MAG: amidohydrolase [Acidobacteria bacterium]|nr:amidohydrolase [Acidobacteriota bacterium]
MAVDDLLADLLIDNGLVVTMDKDRRVIKNGAVAVLGDRIVGVGKSSDLRLRFTARRVIDASDKVVTPGLINCHVHATGEPLAKGFVPDDTPFEENVFQWLCPIYSVHEAEDEYLSAMLIAIEMLKTGTTSFLEAGTVRFVDQVVRALVEVGIRARVGKWVWDIPPEPRVYQQTTDQAIGNLEETIQLFRTQGEGRVQAWSMIIGHTTCSDELMKAAKQFADQYQVGLNMHMSPAAMDPAGFLQRTGRRPIEHLARLGVLGSNVVLVHMVDVDDNELQIVKEYSVNIVHCPTTALKVAYGVTQIGKFPEMLDAGINVTIGCDGSNAANYMDMLRATYLAAGLFKDARRNPKMIPAETALEMATRHGAKALLIQDEVGSLETGKKADIVLFDRHRPEWVPLHNVANSLVYSADGKSVHTVLVDGKMVVENGRMTTVDEEEIYHMAQQAGEAIIARAGLPRKMRWPLI